jgi:hypothetical protein
MKKTRIFRRMDTILRHGLARQGYVSMNLETAPNSVFQFVERHYKKVELIPQDGRITVKFKKGMTSL